MSGRPSIAAVAREVGISPSTLRRWIAEGLVPVGEDGEPIDTTAAQARVVVRLRERGYTLEQIREATESGRLASSWFADLDAVERGRWTLEAAAAETRLEPALIRRIWQTVGFGGDLERLDDDDLRMLRYSAAVLEAGLPLVAFLQIARVYGQAMAQIAEAEVRLFHIYVHEPLMREGIAAWEIADELREMTEATLPLTTPLMDYVHQRFLRHFVEQDIVGHMEADLAVDDGDVLGRMRVAIAFADLAGFTRLTEEAGDEEAVSTVERFVDEVESTLPEDARVNKTIGDEVMIVGNDPAALAEWAVEFQRRAAARDPAPRIGVHCGHALYRDGDYYGRDVNIASRVAARAAAGEVIVTAPVMECCGPSVAFTRLGEVQLKGLSEPTELFAATPAKRS